jgi:hypothetical protein
VRGSRLAPRLYERGLVVKPRVLRRDGAWLREVVARRHGCRRSSGRMGAGEPTLWGAGGVEVVWSSAHVSIASSTFEDLVLSGLAPAAHVKNGLSGSQARNGACRSEGLERLVAGQHVPDRRGELACELDLGDLCAALAAQAALGSLVALLVERV